MEWLANIISLSNAVYTMVIFFAGWSFNKVKRKINAYHLAKVLSFRDHGTGCFLSVPTFNKELLKKDRDIIILNEATLLLKIYSLLHSAKINPFILKSNTENSINEIHIGGPVSNVFTNRYVNHYFKNFKWCATNEHIKRYRSEETLRLLFH